MTLAAFQFTVVDGAGNVVPGAPIEVRAEADGAPLASLYSDRAGEAALGNPFTADSVGFARFFVAGGAYRITVTAGASVITWRYVGISLAGEWPDDVVEAVEAATAAVGVLLDGGAPAALTPPAFAPFGDGTGEVAEGDDARIVNAARLDTADQSATGGVSPVSLALGTAGVVTGGTVTVNVSARQQQHYENDGAHAMEPGANYGSCLLDIVNGEDAGAIDLSAFDHVVGADDLTTTDGDAFRCHISVGEAGSLIQIQAMQD